MYYVFPAVFTPNEECGFMVTVPNVPGCVTSGTDITEAMKMAEDALSVCLCVLEDEEIAIENASTPEQIQQEFPGSFIALVKVDTTQYRAETDNKAVRKNVTVPAWLCTKAERANLNFSQVLQEGLKQQLHIG